MLELRIVVDNSKAPLSPQMDEERFGEQTAEIEDLQIEFRGNKSNENEVSHWWGDPPQAI